MRTRLLVTALLLGTAACGTTVPLGQRTGAQQELGGTQEAGTTGASSTGGGVSGTTGSSGSAGQIPGPAPAGTVGTGSSQPIGSTGTTTGSLNLPSSSNAPVEVGFEYATGVTEFAAALGISADVGDGSQQAKAIVAWVNAHGGLAGHPIKPVFYNLDLTRTDPYSTFMSEMCTLWTQDHHVIAAFTYANADFSPVAHCLTQHHAVYSAYANYSRDHDDYVRNGNWVETAALTSERLAQLQVDTFVQQGFFKGQTKVGLLAYDYEQAARLTTRLVALLKQRGITTVVYNVHYGGSTPELGSTIGSIQNAVLRFRTEGIQRVMSAAYPGAIGFFMRYADSQSYRPLYGLTSYDALGALPANAPVSQLHGAIAAGWWPTADLNSPDRPPLNAAGKICRAVFSKAGIPSSQDAWSFGYCDEVLSLQTAVRQVNPSALTGDAIRLGFEHLGSSYSSPSMLGTTFTAGQHDAVSRARPLAFNDSCSCWRNSGGINSIP